LALSICRLSGTVASWAFLLTIKFACSRSPWKQMGDCQECEERLNSYTRILQYDVLLVSKRGD